MINFLGTNINLTKIILPIIYIFVGIIVFNFLKRVINKATESKKNLKSAQIQRIKTLKILVINIIKYAICILVVLAILANFGINVKSILAGLGIGTALIGLAFQDLAKDVIAGFFIITEGEYEIGETIEIDGFMGEVVFIGLRTTRIRNYKGATKIIANHYMDNLINYSANNSLAVVDIAISSDCKEEDVEVVINNIFKDLKGKVPNATKELELWGVNDIVDGGIIYRIAVETKPTMNFETERFLKKEFKKAFDNAEIKIPYKKIEVQNGK